MLLDFDTVYMYACVSIIQLWIGVDPQLYCTTIEYRSKLFYSVMIIEQNILNIPWMILVPTEVSSKKRTSCTRIT